MPPEPDPVMPMASAAPAPKHSKMLMWVLIAVVILSVVVWGAWYMLVYNGPTAKAARDAAAHAAILKSVPVNQVNAKLTPEDKANILAQFDAKAAGTPAPTTAKPATTKK